MASLNIDDLPDDTRALLDRVIAENPDPLTLAVVVWNMSWDATQGAPHAANE